MAPKKSVPSRNSISCCHSTSSSSSIPLSVRFRNEDAQKDFDKNFSDRVIHSKRQVILSDFPETPLPCAFHSWGWASLYEKLSRCPDVFIQEFYSNMHAIDTSVPRFTKVFCGTCIIVTQELISKILRIPRADHSDYPSHKHLSSISRDELASLFCEKAMLWGNSLNFSTTEFTKVPRILNMVMTFILTPQSHYNTITKSCACFLLLLMEDISIDFLSY